MTKLTLLAAAFIVASGALAGPATAQHRVSHPLQFVPCRTDPVACWRKKVRTCLHTNDLGITARVETAAIIPDGADRRASVRMEIVLE